GQLLLAGQRRPECRRSVVGAHSLRGQNGRHGGHDAGHLDREPLGSPAVAFLRGPDGLSVCGGRVGHLCPIPFVVDARSYCPGAHLVEALLGAVIMSMTAANAVGSAITPTATARAVRSSTSTATTTGDATARGRVIWVRIDTGNLQ